MKKVPGSSSVVESAHNDENLSVGKSLLGGDSVSNSTVKQRPTNLHLKILQDDTKSSQPETCSSSSSEFRVDRLNIDFRNLTYTVNSGILRRERKTLVSGLNGSFHAGELSAIMGPSGAGKTTLLNILSGYIINNYSGSISVNGFQRDLKWFKTQSAYITQDTEIQAYLSVSEAMYFSANLKIGNSLTNAKKRERVRKILEAIGMYDTRHTRSEKLSGGQKKRLSIALELVTNPPILILDEPTSGLDSSTSTQCLSLLKQLAEQGRTIIFTVHQPSAILFGMFDHLYTIAEGKCIFSGGTKSVVPFLNELGLKCPESYNPADYLLEIANNDYGPQNDKLIAKVQNGLCEDYRKNTQITTSQIEVMTKVERMVEAGLLTPVKAPGFKPTNSPPFNSDTGSSSLRDINGTIDTKLNRDDKLSASCYEIDPEKVRLAQRGYSSTFLQQLTYLLMRTFLIRWRNKSLTATKLLIHIVMGVLVGNLYYGIGEDAHHIMNTFRYIFFSIMFNMHTAFASVILNFPLEFPIVSREHFNRWYSLRAYYIALTIADIPVQLLCSFLFMIISYFLTNQPMDVVRIALLYVMIVLSSLVAQSIGLTVGASLDVKNGAIFGPFFICPFLIFSGFFIQIKDVHEMMQWLFHISFLKYSLEGASLALFGYDRPQMECTEIFCQFIRPKRFLKAVGMEQASYEFDVVALIVIFLILRVIAFYIMSIRLKLFR